MLVIEERYNSLTLPDTARNFAQETITLTWEERCKSHGKLKSDQGTAFAISLPSGNVLKNGDHFVLSKEERLIVVIEAQEQVVLIHPRTPREWAYYAYQIGNRHQLLMINDHEMACLHTKAVENILHQLHIPFQPGTRQFNAATNVSAHSH